MPLAPVQGAYPSGKAAFETEFPEVSENPQEPMTSGPAVWLGDWSGASTHGAEDMEQSGFLFHLGIWDLRGLLLVTQQFTDIACTSTGSLPVSCCSWI